MPSGGQRELIGVMLLAVGLLFWAGGQGYVASWLALLSEAWSERIGKILMVIGALLVISALL